MPRVILCDVNDTLLDLRALAPHFERVFGDAAVRSQWGGNQATENLCNPLIHHMENAGFESATSALQGRFWAAFPYLPMNHNTPIIH